MKNKHVLILAITFIIAGALKSQTVKTKTSLNHIAVYVSDLKTSTAFYQQIVGLEITQEPFHDGKHTWFSVGPKIMLHLIQGAAAGTTHDKNSHLCFTVNSVSDFIKNLNKNNIKFESWEGKKQDYTVRVDGVKQIYFTDPDGYWIEINDARE